MENIVSAPKTDVFRVRINLEIIKAKALSRLTKQLQDAQDDPVSYSEDEVYKMFG